MLTAIISLILGLGVSDAEADALRSTAPTYLTTTQQAREHLIAARIAGVESGIDPDLLSSIAWHESRYDHTVRNPREPGGMVSCGVMTPVPMHPTIARANCTQTTSSLLAGYRAGAEHLRSWIDATGGNLRTALIGYAGGWRAIRKCRRGPVIIRPGVDGCKTDQVFLWRAHLIRSRLVRARRQPAILT